MKKNYILTLFLSLLISGITFGQTLMITTISDSDCSGGVPKMVEIYVQGEVNLTQYSLKNLSISSTSGTSSLNSFGTVTDDFIYVYYDNTTPEEVFATEYPSATPSIEATVANFNGDDVIRIIRNSDQTIIDQYGDTDGGIQDGTGTPWEYKDGYAKRINGTTSSGEFTIGDWTVVNGGLNEQGSCQGGTIFEDVMGGIGTYTPASTNDLLIEDFETDLPASALVEDLGTSVSIVSDPETNGTRGQVLKVETSETYVNGDGATATSQPWQNVQYNFQNNGLDLSTDNKIVTIDVYSDVATSVLAKVELGAGGAATSETGASHTGNGWETLTFTFSAADGVFGKLTLFPLWDNTFDGVSASVTTTYYDNISGLAYVPPAQNITVSVDHSTFLTNPTPGVTIRVYNATTEEFDEFGTVEDTENPNIHSYTFAEGVTSATYVWRVYGSDTPTDENLVSLIVGGGVENNLGETSVLGDNNGIDTNYNDFCNRTVTSTSGNYEAPTTYFNSLQKVGVDYTELVLTADAGDNYVLDYSVNDFNENHGPGATDNGDGTYTVIVDPSSAFQYKWNNLTASTQEDLSSCTDGVGVANDGTNSNRTHTAGEDKEDTFGVCPSNSQTITVSVDGSNGNLTGITIKVYDPVTQQFGASIPAVQDPTDSNRWTHTFADGVTSATYYWEFFNPATFSPQGESLVSLVGGGGVENDLAATLGDNNGISTNYSDYCNRTVTSDSGDYVAPTFKFNSFQQVGVTYTELVLAAASGSSYAIDYSKNNFSEFHGPGALDNGDDTYTVIVDPSSTFTYLWYNRTSSTQEDLSACTPASRNHVAGENRTDSFGVCQVVDLAPTTAATTPPTRAAANVISLYSDAYTAATTISNVPWDDSNYEEVSIAGDNVLKIAGANFLGIDFADYLDATNMTHLHMDYWIADDFQAGQVLNPKLSNHAAQAEETNALDITNAIGSQAEVQNWQSKDFELTGDRESLKQFLITVAGLTDLYYLDNVYLYKNYDLPFDFETSPVTADWEGFNGAGITVEDVAAPQTTGNTSTKLAKIVRNGGEVYAGVFTIVDTALDFSTKSTITARIWTDAPIGTPILMKTEEDGNSGNSSGDKTVSTTKTGEWEDLVFNFEGVTNANQRKLVIIPNIGTLGDGTDASTYYIDDIVQAVSTIVDPVDPEPTTAATTPPSRDAADVISLYSDAYTAATTISNVPWDDSNYEEVSIAGDNVLKIAGANFLGIDFADYLDATNMTHLHMDYWIADDFQAGQVLNPKLSNHAAQAEETNALDITNAIGSQAEVQNWQSKDFELTGDRESLKQFLITVAGLTDLYYLDNVYLYKEGDGGESQTITVSIDVSADPGGVNIVTPTVSGSWAEYAATVDPNDANKFSYTFAEGVTSAEFVWKVYETSAGDVQESLTSLVGGGAIENNLAATLPTGNGINTDYSTYCNRTVASDSGDFVAPTFIFNSFKQVGVTYTELVLTADSGDSYAIDYSVNDYSEYHGPGATDNGDGTYTVIVDPSSAFTYLWYNRTTSTQEDLSACGSSNRDHIAGESEADSFGVCPTSASQTITVSIDVSADPGGVNIVTPTVSGSWAEYAATVDPNDANKFSYTFAEGVTSAEFVWKVYETSAGDVQESLTSLVGGGAIENNLAATLPTGNGINTDYSTYCNRTVASDSGDFVAPTFIFNSFKQVGVTYTELVLTADSGDSYAIDYSVNDYSEYHGPGATDNGDGTYTVIVDPSSAFTYLWYNRTTSTQEDLSACGSSNRDHTAGVSEADSFGVCPASADVKDNNIVNVSVYPNPSNSDWNFRTPNTVINSVEVFNLLGKRVASQRSNNNTEISISTQGLTSGIYIARITTEQGTKSVKLIKN